MKSFLFRPAVLTTLATGALSILSGTAAASGSELKIYSPRMNSDAPILRSFEQATGRPVSLVDLTPDEIGSRMDSGTAPADVLFVTDTANLHDAQAAEWFAPGAPIEPSLVDDGLADPEGRWVAYSTRSRVIFVNPEKLDGPVPETYEALADPSHEGQVCIRTGESAYTVSWVASMIHHHGQEVAREWAQGVLNNLAEPPMRRDTEVLEALAGDSGCAIGVANHYYFLRMKDADDPHSQSVTDALTLVWPNQSGEGFHGRGAYRNVTALGVARGSVNPEDAAAFVQHALSDSVQSDVASGLFYPVLEAADSPRAVEELGEPKFDTTPMSDLVNRVPDARALLQSVEWE